MTDITERKRRRILRRASRTMPHVKYYRVIGLKWNVYTRERKGDKWVLRETVQDRGSESMFQYIRAAYPGYYIEGSEVAIIPQQ